MREEGISSSTGRTGTCFDSAVTENFFVSLETELIHRSHFASRVGPQRETFFCAEGFYNPWRRDSANGLFSPAEYGRRRIETM